MSRFEICRIEDEYIQFLHSKDSKVQYNKGASRPYVGIVLTVDAHNYFAPMESPKPNHANIKSGGPVLKLDEGKLGLIGFNNMIPVKEVALIHFNIQEIADENYRNLLQKQLRYCEKNKDIILNRAKTVYDKVVVDKNPFYKRVCCNFKQLEYSCRVYRPRRNKKK